MPSVIGNVTSPIKGAYVPIVSFTGAIGNACCYNFGAIPQIYSDLMLVMNGFNNSSSGSAAANFDGIAPGVTATNPTGTQVNLFTTGNASPSWSYNSDQNYIVGAQGAGTQPSGSYIVWEMNDYANTNKFRSYTIRYGTNNNTLDSSNAVAVGSGTLRMKSGLTSFNISSFNGAHQWTNSTSFTLYGIKKTGQ